MFRKLLRKCHYAKVCASQKWSELEQILYAFFLLVVLWGQYKRYKRKITATEMNMGQEHGKEHFFQHVDALLVSRFGWDSISVCVEIVFIYGVD